MITNSNSNNKPLTSIEGILEGFNIKSLLKRFHFFNRSGTDASIIFEAVFLQAFFGVRNLFRFSQSRHFKDFNISKYSIYRFLRKKNLNWHGLLLSVAKKSYDEIVKCNKADQIYTFVADDTPIERCHAKVVEGVCKIFNHVIGKSITGFLQLQLGVTDGITFLPTVNKLVSSKHLLCPTKKNFDQRTCGAQIRKDLFIPKPELLIKACKATLSKGIYATHILLDSWFYSDDIINKFKAINLDIICRIKSNLTFADASANGELRKTQKELYCKAKVVHVPNLKGTVKQLNVLTESGNKLKLVFVPNTRKKSERSSNEGDFIVIASSDLSLSAQTIVQLYSRRWIIETNFRTQKQFLGLGKETQARCFDTINAFMNISSLRYIVLELMHRINNDKRALGELYTANAEYIQERSFTEALDLIVNVLLALPQKIKEQVKLPKRKLEEITNLIYAEIDNAISSTSTYIRSLFDNKKRSIL